LDETLVTRLRETRGHEEFKLGGFRFLSRRHPKIVSPKSLGTYLGAMGESDNGPENALNLLVENNGVWLWSLLKEKGGSRRDRDLLKREEHLDQNREMIWTQRRMLESFNYGFSFFSLTQSFGVWHLGQIARKTPNVLTSFIDHLIITVPCFGLNPQDPLGFAPFYAQNGASDLYADAEKSMRTLAQLGINITLLVGAKDPVVDLDKTRQFYDLIPKQRRRVVVFGNAGHRIFTPEDNPQLDYLLKTFPRLCELEDWKFLPRDHSVGVYFAHGHESFPA
jgi:pimeloyl-ACP methyl ester carboxylesterase